VLAFMLNVVLAWQMHLSPQATLPSSLLFRQSQAMGNQVEVVLRNGDTTELVLRRKRRFSPGPSEQVSQPSASQWQHFRAQLDQIRVWSWPSHCPNSGKVLDGSQWVLEIRYPDRQIQASGDNCFPDAEGQPVAQPSPTPAFSRLVQAMEGLTGQSLAP
jgi:hypothetical protein